MGWESHKLRSSGHQQEFVAAQDRWTSADPGALLRCAASYAIEAEARHKHINVGLDKAQQRIEHSKQELAAIPGTVEIARDQLDALGREQFIRNAQPPEQQEHEAHQRDQVGAVAEHQRQGHARAEQQHYWTPPAPATTSPTKVTE